MKKDKKDELRPEYKREDLGKGIRGKYYEDWGRLGSASLFMYIYLGVKIS